MAAFQFPDPAVQDLVVNPVTGSTYKWKADPGKWVIVAQNTTTSDIIWEGPNPPLYTPDDTADYKLWYNTDTLELYFYYTDINGNSAWVPTSKPITMIDDLAAEVDAAGADIAVVKRTLIELEDDIANVVGSLGQVTLEEVLENGNTADKGIILTNATDDALLLSPEEGRIMVGGKGDVVPKLELRHTTGILDTSLVALELDQNGKRFDIECDEKVDNIHFRFNNDDKLVLNKAGEAELFGQLRAEPGENTNQVIVYDQYKELQDSVISLQQEIEKLSLVLDEGGDYRLLSTPENPADFIRNGIVYFGNTVGNPLTEPQSWGEVGSIFIDTIDRNGNTHDFGPDVVQAGDLIELVGDNSFALFEVKGIGQYEEGLDKKFALWGTNTIKSTGVPGPQDTEYTIKSFRLGSLDVAETDARYVNLTGDEMTGPLQIKPATAATSLDIFPGPGQSSGTSILRVYGDGNQTNLYVSGSGSLGARQGWSPSLSNHLTTKNYVDLLDAQTRDYVDSEVASHSHSGFNSQALWKAADHQRAADLQVGEFFIADGGNVYFHPKSDNGFDLGLSSSATGEDLIMLVSIYSTNGNSVYCITTDKITFNNGLNKYIRVQKIHERHNNRTISAGTQYALKVPGFTP